MVELSDSDYQFILVELRLITTMLEELNTKLSKYNNAKYGKETYES